MTQLRDTLDNLEARTPTPLLYRRARSLAYFINGRDLVVYNFLSNRSFSCGIRCFELLVNSDEWQPLDSLFEILEDNHTTSVVEEYISLFSLTALVVKGDPLADLDEEYERTWEWGNVTGLLHFSIKDNPTVPDKISIDSQNARAQHEPSPKLYGDNHLSPSSIALTPFNTNTPLYATMRARRTIRAFQQKPIKLEAISDMLFSGLGITDIIQTPVGNHPLKMTPSPGARNPYDAFVFANNIEGLLRQTFYHYDAFHHSVSISQSESTSPLSMKQMLASNQPWVESAGAIIILVAHFGRVMWKYPNGNAYLSVLIEAGHIGQNIMLAATHHGLVANPSGAISQSLIERALGIDKVNQGVIYVLAVGFPDASADYVQWLTPELEKRHQLLRENNCPAA